MKAVVLAQPGPAEALEVREVPDPVPGHGELLVRLRAAGVNPVDRKQRAAGPRKGGLPAILGCDGAGIVAGTGRGAKRLREGDEVFFCYGGLGGMAGCYAELTVVPESSVTTKPKSISFREAAAAPLVLITAWESLHDRLEIRTGGSILILGGTGGVGHVAIQLALEGGVRSIVTAGSPEKAAFALSLGAERALLYKEEDVIEGALDWTGGAGVDWVLDTVSGPLGSRAFEALAVYGKAASILAPTEAPPWGVMSSRNLGYFIELMLTPQMFGLSERLVHQREILERCGGLFDARRLKIHVERNLPLERAAEAHRIVENAGTMGKIVLDID